MTGIDNHNAETLSVPAKGDEAPLERREVLRRFGVYAAVTHAGLVRLGDKLTQPPTHSP